MVTYGIAAAVWFLSLVGDASATNFKECRSFFNKKVGSLPLNVTLSNCDKYPCDLARGSEIYGGMDFIYDKDLSVLIPKITVYLVGFPLSWPINQKDGCTSLTLNKCPIKAGTTARYEYSLFLGPLIPLVSIKGDFGKVVAYGLFWWWRGPTYDTV
ncbi:Hypothetical predicted protein [Cloeon dipterum]|uniref:MD-2-related lipid-recognition domain-containing protein n=1 Tax=Cloeon dipterum TaxID=197152 RepID=A0A8S1BWN4_9INSE|nr:Hypothetical predicted protein [Cloeon dipterum]